MIAKRTFNRKRTYRRKRPSTFRKAVSTIAKRVVLRQSETKTAEYTHPTSATGTNGSFFAYWKQVVQGDSQNNRDGDRIHALGIKFRSFIYVNSSLVSAANTDAVYYRLVIFSAKRPIGSITDSGLDYYKAVDPELLNIHYDRLHSFDNSKRVHCFQRYIKFNRIVQYNPSGGECSKNELYAVLLPQQTIAAGLTAGDGVAWNCKVQLYWKDL